MAYVSYNPNPCGKQNANDSYVRAFCKVMNVDWGVAYSALCARGYALGEMPNSSIVWTTLLLDNGYLERSLMDKTQSNYNVDMFCNDYPNGEYVVVADNKIIYIRDGKFYDSIRSSDIVLMYYFEKVYSPTQLIDDG